MKPVKPNIRAAIDDYFRGSPDGLDVMAFVLNEIGEVALKTDARTSRRTLDEAKEELGRLVSEELLPQMFSDVEALEVVQVDSSRWPDLATWVTSYTQHRVGARTGRR